MPRIDCLRAVAAALLVGSALLGCSDGRSRGSTARSSSPLPVTGAAATSSAPAPSASAAAATASATPATAASAAAAPGWPLAITIDDLPWVGKIRPGDSHASATERLLAALTRHGVVATGFVVCSQLGTEGLAQQWVAAHMELGNHTSHHRDLNDGTVDAWIRDVRDCETPLTALTGSRPRFFRYPYLHQGTTSERRDAAAAELGRMGYRVAQVTLHSHDWVFAAAYGKAINGQGGDAATIVRDYLSHVRLVAAHARERAQALEHREIAQVMLIHANALEAAELDAVLTELSAQGARFVSLDEALSDAVYSRPDGYAGPQSRNWLDHLAPAPSEGWDHTVEQSLLQAMP